MAKSYLEFIFMGESSKTSTWKVCNRVTGELVGGIAWFCPFRKYAYCPAPRYPGQGGTFYDSKCLREIATFIDTEMKLRELEKTLGTK